MGTQTTSHLATTGQPRTLRRRLAEQDRWLLACVLAILAILAGGALLGAWQRWDRSRSTPIIIMVTPTLPTPAPTAEVAAEVAPDLHTSMTAVRTLPCAVIAYSEPDRATEIRALAPGLAFTPTEQISGEWVRAEVTGAGSIWMTVQELTCITGVPDAAPPPAPQEAPVVMLVAAPAAAEPAAQPTVAPPPPPPTAAPAPTAAPWMVLDVGPTQAATPTDWAASFQEPPRPNPFIGCISEACREQFGQPESVEP